MPLDKQHLPQPRLNLATDEITFKKLDEAVFEDLHNELSHLKSEGNEVELWINLEGIFRSYCKSLGYLGSKVPQKEVRHARGTYRCIAALVTEIKLLETYGRSKGESLLSTVIANDPDFRLVYVLWRWSQECATESSSFAELAHQFKDIKELSGRAMSDMKRLIATRKVAVDPDSMLTIADDPAFEKLTRVIFSLLRCGRFDEAMELSDCMFVPWMIPVIRTQQLLLDSTLISAEMTSQEKACLLYRKTTYEMMVRAVAETKYTMPVRMIFAALTGDWKFLLPLATSIDDRLWCYANAAVQSRMNAALGIEHPIFAPTTIEGIFEAVTAIETNPYYSLMSFLMREAWEDAVDWMYEYCKKLDEEKRHGAELVPLYRFFGLIMSVCRIMKHDHDERHAEDLIGRMINALLQRKLYSLIPFYASLLSKDEALKRVWNVMPDVNTDCERVAFIAAMKDAGFDGEEIATEYGRFRIVESGHHTDDLRWIFACGDAKLLNAIVEANSIIRNYLLNDMRDQAATLIAECEHLKLAGRLAAVVQNADRGDGPEMVEPGIVIDEFNNHCLYLAALKHCENFSLESSKAHGAARQSTEDVSRYHDLSRLDDSVDSSFCVSYTERNKAAAERSNVALGICKMKTMDAVKAFLQHPGWRTETTTDWGRSEQLQALRARFYAQVLKMLLKTFATCVDADAVLDLLVMLVDDDLSLYKDLSKNDLCRFLDAIHKLAGHAVG